MQSKGAVRKMGFGRASNRDTKIGNAKTRRTDLQTLTWPYAYAPILSLGVQIEYELAHQSAMRLFAQVPLLDVAIDVVAIRRIVGSQILFHCDECGALHNEPILTRAWSKLIFSAKINDRFVGPACLCRYLAGA